MVAGLIKEIVLLEWQMFDRVHNRGGRASCQDDWETFSIMRTSQLAAWSRDTLESYRDDLVKAEREGRNLLQEKYAYMMASTAPDEYARIRHLLPEVEPERQALIDAAASMQIGEMETIVAKYPHVAAGMRPLRASLAGPGCTSLETYLRGELCTYSLQTLKCYCAQLQQRDASYSYTILNQTAVQYGCGSLEELETLLQRAES